MDQGIRKVAQAILLALLSVGFVVHLWRTASTGEDLPSNWAYLMGILWGVLLGIKEILDKFNGKGGKDA